MYLDIISATYCGDYKIKLVFEDRKSGIVDFKKYVQKGGVFNKFSDIEFFKNFKINQDLGVITWCGDIDIAPETIYSEATKSPLPEWMEKLSEQVTEPDVNSAALQQPPEPLGGKSINQK